MLSQITIRNTGSSAVQGWTLAFDLPEGQSVSNAWNAQISPSSGRVTATNLPYDATIAPGSTVSIGFIANRTGSAAAPASYSLNGVACTTT
jgi:endo-1,4-beta-xylanase